MDISAASRRLFVNRLLVAPETPPATPEFRYDEIRGVNVLSDGRAAVEVSSIAGTETFTKVDTEGTDSDSPEVLAGTMTETAVRAEKEDSDAAQSIWCATQLDTRQGGGDVETDRPL